MSAPKGSTRSNVRKLTKLYAAYAIATNERTAHPLVQSGRVFGESVCAGCGRVGVWLIDDYDAWCPSCGGAELVAGALDLDYPAILTLKAYLDGSNVVHLLPTPTAKSTLCMPLATIGRMRLAGKSANVNCGYCVAERDRVAEGND